MESNLYTNRSSRKQVEQVSHIHGEFIVDSMCAGQCPVLTKSIEMTSPIRAAVDVSEADPFNLGMRGQHCEDNLIIDLRVTVDGSGSFFSYVVSIAFALSSWQFAQMSCRCNKVPRRLPYAKLNVADISNMFFEYLPMFFFVF